ncbi:hypothetical protein COT48_04385 [Candidatus Woesearchaeota archaeon CG08_land_8_20_14_0_20_47_9]|nr:MAG: hypothetical protein COT48_04385 [Candidatus Woesearchaeota archaeon CG08_land_8_20_14_0_20_47_9]
MTSKIYLDTNIYLDYLLDRKNRFRKDLGSIAFSIINRSFLCEFEIVLSDWCFQELVKQMV